MESPPLLRAWLFRIAYNTAMDFLRRYEHRNVEVAADTEVVADSEIAPREDLRAVPGWVDGVPAIAVFRPASSRLPGYFVRIEWRDDRVARVRDFRYVPYIALDASFKVAGAFSGLWGPRP